MVSDAAWFPRYESPERYHGSAYTSLYLTMRDGVRIAVDLHLPRGLPAGARIPAIMHQTRYFRSVELRWPLRLFTGGRPFDHTQGLFGKPRRRFVEAGYAWLDVDVRGSGASFGSRICPWSPDEILDGGEIVDWIVAQPWSNGAVGARGVSYDGTTAEFLLLNKHPAVKAVAPRFSLFDAYTDIAYPGGIRASWFLGTWRDMNQALDRNAPHEVSGAWTRLFITGVTPVARDRGDRSQAVTGHGDNYDVATEAGALVYRDDVSATDPYHRPDGGERLKLAGTPVDDAGSIGLFSPHNYWPDLAACGAAVYSYGGWYDGAYARGAISRHLTVRTPGSRLILGPWNHGGGWNSGDPGERRATEFDHEGELLRFFDHHLKGRETGIEREPPVHYFVVHAGWRTAESWPPPTEAMPFYLGDRRELRHVPPSGEGCDVHRVDPTAGTGPTSRWRTQAEIDRPVLYPDRRKQGRKLLAYTSAPLERAMEIAGHPMVTLFIESDNVDGIVVAYLEDQDPTGQLHYVTEGVLRALHRQLTAEQPPYRQVSPPDGSRTFKRGDALPLVPGEVAQLTFDLLPVAYRFRSGHRVRLCLGGADRDHFEPLSDGWQEMRILHSPTHPSRIELPVVQ